MSLAFDAVVFDLDGTLIDSAPDMRVALNRVLGRKGRRSLELAEMVAMIGDGAQQMVAHAFAATGAPAAEDDLPMLTRNFLDFYEPLEARLTRPYPGVVETLDGLAAAGLSLGLCTNKPHAPALELLDALGLGRHFDAVIGMAPGRQRKPDPGTLLAVIEALGASPACSVMVGDSANDIGSARNGGVKSVAVAYGYARGPAAALGADTVIQRFADLPEALAALC